MRKKIIAVGVISIAVIIIAIFALRQSDTTAAPVALPPKEYTAAEVAAHKSADDCWTIIDGAVYDATKFIPVHPGGDAAILKLCGKDGTDAFNKVHKGVGYAVKKLLTLKIGTVVTAQR